MGHQDHSGRRRGPHGAWLDALPVAALVAIDGRLVHANRALAQLLGREPGEGETLEQLVASAVVGDERERQRVIEALRDEAASVALRIRTASGEASVWLRASAPVDGARCWVVGAPPEGAARRLVDTLAWASSSLARARDADAALAIAVDAIHWDGFDVAAFAVEPSTLSLARVRAAPAALAEIERAAGSLSAIRRRRGEAGVLDAALGGERAMLARGLAPGAVIEGLAASAAILAPVRVDGAPFAILAVTGERLGPDVVAAIDLFAAQLGAASEAARARRRAEARVAELEQRERALVVRERMAALGEAAAVLAHEIRNPLAVIRNVLALLAREDARDAAALRGILEEETTRLEELVRDLLQLARPLEPQRSAIDLVDVARRVVAELRATGERPDVALEISSDAPAVTLSGDASLLSIALGNLVRNGVEASPTGRAVRVRIGTRDGFATVTIEDDGAGVDARDASRIFEPFFTKRARGTGLGLAIVRRVVEAHGGRVALDRAARAGARFEVVLPRE